MKLVEKILHDGECIAIIIRAGLDAPGVTFFTEDSLSQQLAHMHHPKGKVIEPHIHNAVPREVTYTQEVLVIRSGKLRVDFYSEQQEYLSSRILGTWDIVLLIKGGHGFEILEDLRMYEIKQGPYAGDRDKTRFLVEPSRENLRIE